MMSSTFPPPYLSLGVSPPAGLCEDSVPFLWYRSGPATLGGPGLLPYLAPLPPLSLPHPGAGPYSLYQSLEPAFIQKRNERERQRVQCVNQGYAALRDRLPAAAASKRLSKVETLRAAIRYIKYLQGLVQLGGPGDGGEAPPLPPLHLMAGLSPRVPDPKHPGDRYRHATPSRNLQPPGSECHVADR